MTTVAHQPAKGHRTLRLPIDEADHERFLADGVFAKERIEALHGQHPELFPEEMGQGFVLCGFTAVSRKQQVRCRRIRLRAGGTVLTVAPAFLMPYMSARVPEVQDALFLMRFHVPCWAIAHVFGRDAMYWYRLENGLGRFSVLGTTVKTPEALPEDLVADEKHTRRNGEKVHVATTAGGECLLGASVAESASEADLKKAYGVFADEAKALDPDCAPRTVNTDGWAATQKAWQALYSKVTVILCFLHGFLEIRDRATKVLSGWFDQTREKVWHA